MAAPMLKKKNELIIFFMGNGEREGFTYSICITPSAPKPKSFPRTGKNRLKNAAGNPISDKIRTTAWPMIKSLLSTAQKAPAGWFGTVLPL